MNDTTAGVRNGLRQSLRRWTWAGFAGIVSGAVFLAVAELLALAVARQSGPLLAVGSFVIDIVPQPFKEFAIATFGANDKTALLAGLGLAAVVGAALAGILQTVRPPAGLILLGAVGVVVLVTTVTRVGATGWSFAPPIAGVIAGGATLVVSIRRLRRWDAASRAEGGRLPAGTAPAAEADRVTGAVYRRQFFVFTGIAAASAVVIGVGARAINAASSSIAGARDALKLPRPRTTVPIPDGADLRLPGLSALFTPNPEFYRVDTALTVPAIDPAQWRLRVTGMVDQEVEMGFDELVGMGLDEYAVTLTCVSNEVGGDLVGNALWQGVPVREVLKRARPQSGADMVLSRSIDGFTASTPLESLTDANTDAILAVAMNGEPLPLEHGFPVRMVVPGLYGYVSATKWLTELKVTTFAADQAYWTPRGYSAQAPVKLSSRIDTPSSGTPVSAGRVTVAGVAWAQAVGIETVEVRIDDGAWESATLAAPINIDTWVQWRYDWDAVAGPHYVTVRATDRRGHMQVEDRAPIAPDGSTGWQRLLITVT